MTTTTLTVLALLLTLILAAFGVLGFVGNWTSAPDPDSLRVTQVAAKAGRYCAYGALTLHTLGHTLQSAPALLWFATGALAAATYLTRTSNRIVPAGATP